jgi:hypothetical protein
MLNKFIKFTFIIKLSYFFIDLPKYDLNSKTVM